jgi:hypothetical protein
MEAEGQRSLVLGVLLGAAVGALGVTAVNKWVAGSEREVVRSATRVEQKVGEEEAVLMSEQCKRNVQFLGEDNFRKLANSKIIIVGLGGTGSHAASLLARSGDGLLRFIDLDQVGTHLAHLFPYSTQLTSFCKSWR